MPHQRTDSTHALLANISDTPFEPSVLAMPIAHHLVNNHHVNPSEDSFDPYILYQDKAADTTGVYNVPPWHRATKSRTTDSLLPEGGLQAWLTILGAWFIFFATLGYLYSFGVFQDYYTRFLLSSHTPGKIAWIGSIQLMLPFFLGAVSGKLFDSGHFYVLEASGAVVFAISLFMLSLVKPQQYYQVFLAQGLGMGLGLGLTFVPTASLAGHYFKKRRALATGIALSGGAMGSVAFPIMINHLIPVIGFEKAVQSSAYIVLGCLILGNALMQTSYPERASEKAELPDIKGFFVDAPYMWGNLGALLANFGIFFPITYLQLYAVQHNIDPSFAFYSISIVNGMGAIGRIGANFLADKYGAFNIFIPCTFFNTALVFAVFGVRTEASLILFSVLFGLISGAWLSLSIAVLASLARRPDEVGARTGISLAIGSFGALGAAPAQGALLTGMFVWYKPILFSGVMLGASSVCFLVTRTLLVTERRTQKV